MEQPPKTIRESIRREGFKGFLKRWGDGIQKIPQENLVLAEIYGQIGTLVGTIVAGALFIFWPKMWPISLIMSFNMIIVVSQMVGKIQQYLAIKKFKANFQDQTINLNKILGE